MNKSMVQSRTKVDLALMEIQGKVLRESGAYVIDEGGSKVAYMMEAPAMSDAHKRRIVAAVNACAGISLEDLRSLGVGGLATLLERVRGGAREEGPEAVAVVVEGEDARAAEQVSVEIVENGSPNRKASNGTVSVYVVAWRYSGGAGFHWYADKAEADEAFREEKQICREMRDSLWTAYRCEVKVGEQLMKDEITAQIAEHIDWLCVQTKDRFAVGSGMKLAA